MGLRTIIRSRKIRIIIAGTVLIAAMLAWVWPGATSGRRYSQSSNYDIVVVGAGPGGIAGSLQAARLGKRVALLEPTDWVGGQMTAAGVGSMDEGSPEARKSGIYAEFVRKVVDYYSARHKSVNTCYYPEKSICVDPQIGRLVLLAMLRSQSNLHIYTGTNVTAVTKRGNTVTGVDSGNRHFGGKIVIDADEYGDLLPMAGAAYSLGNADSSHPNPGSCVQDITYAAVIKFYPNGVPSGLRFQKPPPGYTPELAAHFAKYINHDPQSFDRYAAYRGLPDLANPSNYTNDPKNGQKITRTAINLGNDYPQSGTLSTKFIDDRAVRTKTACESKLVTLQFLYYIQHDLGQTNWSIADDEGYSTEYNRQHRCPELAGFEAFEDNMSQEPYVREGRRLVGENTLTGKQAVNKYTRFADSIAVGYYPVDLHSCNTQNTLDSSADDAKELGHGAAFEVPMGALIPEKVDGLLAVEKNISVSRLANGRIREQPIAMNTGQAAGALAALAVQQHKQPRRVLASDVQAVLRRSGAVTKIP